MIKKIKLKSIKNIKNEKLFIDSVYLYLQDKNISCKQIIIKKNITIFLSYEKLYIHPFDIEDKTFIRNIKKDIKKIYKETKSCYLLLKDIVLPNTKYLLINKKIQPLNINKYNNISLTNKSHRKAIENIVFILISEYSNNLIPYKLIWIKDNWEIKML
jgi:hypothetical protein